MPQTIDRRFIELDGLGVLEPSEFELSREVAKVRRIAPLLERGVGASLTLIDNIEDSAAYADLGHYQDVSRGKVANAIVAFTFSRFGSLVLLWSNTQSDGELSSRYEGCIQTMNEAGFIVVTGPDLYQGYAGVQRIWLGCGHSWRDRFFGEP